MDSSESYSPESTPPSSAEGGSNGEHTSKLTEELQEMANKTNGKDATESTSNQTERLHVFDGVTKPESRRYVPDERYRFLIHGVIESSTARSEELGVDQMTDFDRSDSRPLNCSLIDSSHTTTFEGKNGFIIQPPTDGEAVVAAYGSDAGVNDATAESQIPTADELLASTSAENYNQVNVTRGKIEGVFIRVRPDGSELGNPGQNAELRQLAETHGWPVAEIVASPLDLKAGEAHLATETIGDGLTKWSIDLPEDGSILKFDIVKYDDLQRAREANEKAHFTFDEHGIDIRLRQIDSYGQTGHGDIDDKEILTRVADRVRQEIIPQADEQTRQTLELGLDRLLDSETAADSTEISSSQAAFEQHYAEYTSPDYIEPNNERAEAGKGQATVYEHDGHIIYTFAQIKLNEAGETVGGHDENPEAQSFKDQEENFAKFLEMTAAHPESRVVVVEGTIRGPFADRDEAIMTASDSGLSQHLARENGVEIVTAESADNQDLIEEMVEAGIERSMAENYFIVRDAAAFLDGNPDKIELLGSIIHSSLARQGREGFHEYSQQEKDNIVELGIEKEIFKKMNSEVAPLLDDLNKVVGQELFSVQEDGSIGLNPELMTTDPNTGAEIVNNPFAALDPSGQGRGSELSRLNIKLRDQHIWETIARLEAEGKDIFMDYGGSHIMTLRPVMEAYFGPPIEKNY